MTDPEDEDEPLTKTGGRLSDDDFRAATEIYERGDMGVAELSDEFGVSRQALYKRFKKLGIVKGSKPTMAPPAKIVERFAEKRADFIEETRLQGYQALRQSLLIARKIAMDELKRVDPLTGLPIGDLANVDDALKAAGRLNKIVADNVLASLRVLNADNYVDTEDLPNLSIDDLTDDDLLEFHKNTGALEEDATLEDLARDIIDEEPE